MPDSTDPATNLRDSLIRTYAPIIAGALGAWLVSKGVKLDPLLLIPLVTAIYYTFWRVLETKVPAVGWLLGIAKQPAYSPKDAPPAQPAPGEVDEDDPQDYADLTDEEQVELIEQTDNGVPLGDDGKPLIKQPPQTERRRAPDALDRG